MRTATEVTGARVAAGIRGGAPVLAPPTFHLGTLHVSTNLPIARFTVIEQSDNGSRILNLDRLVSRRLP